MTRKKIHYNFFHYIVMFHIFLHKYLICAVMKTQLLIYNTQQMRYANTIVCHIMSVLLHYVSAVTYIFMY